MKLNEQFQYSEDEQIEAIIITLACSILSIVSIIITLLYTRSKWHDEIDSQTSQRNLTIPLLIADMIAPTTIVIFSIIKLADKQFQIGNHSFFCQLSGFLIVLGLESIISNTFMTNLSIYCIVMIKSIPNNNLQIYIRAILPLIASLIPIFFSAYGPVDPLSSIECFLHNQYFDLIYQLIPLISLNITLFVLNYKCYSQLNRNEYAISRSTKLVLLSYSIIFCVTWIPVVILRIQYLIYGNTPISFLKSSALGVAFSGGFFDSIVYGWLQKRKDNRRTLAQSDENHISDELLVLENYKASF